MGRELEQEAGLAWAANSWVLVSLRPSFCKSHANLLPGVVPVNKPLCVCLRSGELTEGWGETGP